MNTYILLATNAALIIICLGLFFKLMSYRTMSMIDKLSGLYNRRCFEEDYKTIRIRRGEDNHILILMDVDKFKLINDIQGHSAGDKCIHDIGQALKATLRTTDKIYRIGGDEFAILTNNLIVLDKIRKAMPVPVSLGYAELTEANTMLGVYALADTRLYDNKNSK